MKATDLKVGDVLESAAGFNFLIVRVTPNRISLRNITIPDHKIKANINTIRVFAQSVKQVQKSLDSGWLKLSKKINT